MQIPMQRWLCSHGQQTRFWRPETPVPWVADYLLVSQRQTSKEFRRSNLQSCIHLLEQRIEFFLGEFINQEYHLGTFPTQKESNHDALSTLSGFKALSVDELKKLVNVEKCPEAPDVTAPVPVIRITECRDAEKAVNLPTVSPSPSRSSSSSSVNIDTNSASFVENELRQTHDLIMAHIDAELGLEMILGGDEESAIKLLRSAARAGSAEASHNLGVAYQQMGDLERAAASYVRASSRDYVPSLKNLAMFYRRGLGGVEKSDELARDLSERAIRLQEREEGEDNIWHCKKCEENGWCNQDSRGPARREVIATSPESLYLLARAYHFGLSGCPTDVQYAKALYKSAADAGHTEARNMLRDLEGKREDCDRLNVEDEEEADIISPLTTFDSSRTYLRKTSFDSGFEIVSETHTP